MEFIRVRYASVQEKKYADGLTPLVETWEAAGEEVDYEDEWNGGIKYVAFSVYNADGTYECLTVRGDALISIEEWSKPAAVLP